MLYLWCGVSDWLFLSRSKLRWCHLCNMVNSYKVTYSKVLAACLPPKGVGPIWVILLCFWGARVQLWIQISVRSLTGVGSMRIYFSVSLPRYVCAVFYDHFFCACVCVYTWEYGSSSELGKSYWLRSLVLKTTGLPRWAATDNSGRAFCFFSYFLFGRGTSILSGCRNQRFTLRATWTHMSDSKLGFPLYFYLWIILYYFLPPLFCLHTNNMFCICCAFLNVATYFSEWRMCIPRQHKADLWLVVFEVHVILVSVLVGKWDQRDDLWPHQRPLSQNLSHHLTSKVWHDVSEKERYCSSSLIIKSFHMNLLPHLVSFQRRMACLGLASSQRSPEWGAAAPSYSSPFSWSSPGWWQLDSNPCAASTSSHRKPHHSYDSKKKEGQRDEIKNRTLKKLFKNTPLISSHGHLGAYLSFKWKSWAKLVWSFKRFSLKWVR